MLLFLDALSQIPNLKPNPDPNLTIFLGLIVK
jgi:hypothetical protein